MDPSLIFKALGTIDLEDFPQGTRWQSISSYHYQESSKRLTSLLLWSLIASIYFNMKEYANKEEAFNDEVYKKIRNYQSQKQFNLKMQWWIFFFTRRIKNLKQLFRHKKFILVFDAFLKIFALLIEMRINTLYKMFAIKCDEINDSSSIVWMRSSIAKKSYIIFNTLSNFNLIYFNKIKSRWLK